MVSYFNLTTLRQLNKKRGNTLRNFTMRTSSVSGKESRTQKLRLKKRKKHYDMDNEVTHQFGMFGFDPLKIQIIDRADTKRLAQAVKNGRTKFKSGDFKGAAEDVREVREYLESFERRLSSMAKPKKERATRKLRSGDEIVAEIGGHGKTEFIDAVVISVTHRGVNMKTYWGSELRDHPPRLVRRR